MTRFITPSDLHPLGIRYSMVHLSRLEKAGDFPRRVRIGRGRIGWVASEVEQWAKERVKARDEALAETADGGDDAPAA